MLLLLVLKKKKNKAKISCSLCRAYIRINKVWLVNN